MRRILALMTLVIGAWYLRKRWRWIWLQGGVQAMMALLRAGARGAPAMLGKMAVAVRATAEEVRSRAIATAGTAAGMARGASDIGMRKAEEGTSAAAQGAANLQEAPGTVANQAEQMARRTTGSAPRAAGRATGSARKAARRATGIAAEPAELAAGVTPEPVEPGVTKGGGTREDEADAAKEGIAPDAERPAPPMGTGTATPTGDVVRPHTPAGGEPTSMGVPETLPSDLTPGEPGTGGPAGSSGSSQAPSRPDSAETRTTGTE